MGYTHYFTYRKGFSDAQWAEIKKSLDVAIKNMPKHSTSAGAYHRNDPLVIKAYDGESDEFINSVQSIEDVVLGDTGNETILFNGDQALAHQDMVLHQQQAGDFNFCKTERKPYDWMVAALLLIVHSHAHDVMDLRSDGDANDFKDVLDWLNEIMPNQKFEGFISACF